jgi:hypothetical protein
MDSTEVNMFFGNLNHYFSTNHDSDSSFFRGKQSIYTWRFPYRISEVQLPCLLMAGHSKNSYNTFGTSQSQPRHMLEQMFGFTLVDG